jgi:hypothetical protein
MRVHEHFIGQNKSRHLRVSTLLSSRSALSWTGIKSFLTRGVVEKDVDVRRSNDAKPRLLVFYLTIIEPTAIDGAPEVA